MNIIYEFCKNKINKGIKLFQDMKKDSQEPPFSPVPSSTKISSGSGRSNKFPLSLLKLHLPCRDLQQLHTSIKERFTTILQGSFRPVPSLPEYYYFSPRTLHHSSEVCEIRSRFQIQRSLLSHNIRINYICVYIFFLWNRLLEQVYDS